MTRDQILLALQQEYRQRQESNLRLYESRTDKACAEIPGISELIHQRHALVMGSIRQGLLSPGRDGSARQDLPALMADMNRQIRQKLISGGYPEDYLQPIYTCPLCRDEGYVFDPSRRMCECLSRELNRRLLEEAGLSGDDQTFERYDPSIFSDREEAGNVSQRQMADYIRRICEEYADSFPNTRQQNLLLSGKSGLGKTFMLRCIAHRTAQRGIQPMYVSAYHFLELARKGYMDNSPAPLAPLMDAPLLLIDDLGTEPLMQNITVTQLFNLLNERQLRGLHTVISTNLDISELKERYTERISSRLMDSAVWRRLHFIGEDVRNRAARS